MTQSARNLLMDLGERAARFRYLDPGPDSKFTAALTAVFTAEAIWIVHTPARAPRANSIAERWIGSLRRELLDQILIVNRRQLERSSPSMSITTTPTGRTARSARPHPPSERRSRRRPATS